ncbi:MAG: HAD family hydrolase [Erysipelotrichaceae bacterium]|nr:HAD family hydrolase [Erysipelotrichaceae bacterium]
MIKLFASDLDGTILYGVGPDDYCKETIQMILDHKRYFAVTTGRPLFYNQAEGIGFMDYDILYIAMNGAVIRDSSFNIIYRNMVPKDILRSLAEEYYDAYLEFCGPDNFYIMQSKDEYLRYLESGDKKDKPREEFIKYFLGSAVFDADVKDILNADIIKVNGRFINKEKEHLLIKEFCRKHSDVICNTPFRPDWCEITSLDATKGNSVRKLAALLGIKEDEVAVFGDEENDISMLSMFENAYVPENGSDEAKKYAKEITDTVTNHGILNKMRELLDK